MLDNIIKFSLRNKYLILFAGIVLIVAGIRTAMDMDIDVFPDLTAPTVVVMTDAHGMATEEVEMLVTFPIESAVNGAADVRRVRSHSAQGFSFVWVEFDWGTDILKARQTVSERLLTVSTEMPIGVSQPVLAPQASIMGEIFLIGLQADSTSMMKLRTIAEWDIKPLILGTGGVAQVTIIGGEYKQYQVLANPQLMEFYNISMFELANTCKNISQNSSGGILREYGNEYIVRGIARTSDLEKIGSTLIKSVNGKPVKVNDVAEVVTGSAPKMGEASGNAKPAVILSVSKQPKANTLDLTRRIESNISDMQKNLPPDVIVDTKIFRQADFISTSVRNIQNALIEGGILVVIILFLFLGSYRTTMISLLAIPLSLLGTVLVMKVLGMTINTMSLGGMAIAIGSLVDDAIIDVENVYKRLRQNRILPEEQKRSSFIVVFEASKEIRTSILNATLIIIVAFAPLFFLSGMEGRMLKPLGIAYIVALFVSLIVAMTIVPLLAKMVLSGDNYLAKNEKDKWLARQLQFYYLKSLKWVLKNKQVVLLSTLSLLTISLITFTTLGRSFLPEFNEGSLTISVLTPPGTSLDETNKIGNIVEIELLSIAEITGTARRTGRGELDEHAQTTNSSELDVKFELNKRSHDKFVAEVRHKLSHIPGIAFTVGQPIGHRIDHMISGTAANIAIKIFGTDLNEMFNTANEIRSNILNIDGLVDVNVDQQVETPQLQIRANRNMLAKYGITLEEFNRYIDIALGGEKLSDIYEGQRRFDLVLRLNKDYIGSIEGLRTAFIDTRDGGKIPLEQVAEIVSTSGPGSITRENVQRNVIVSANVAGRDILNVVKDIQKTINNNIALPEGYRIEYGGQFESEARASRTLLLTSIIALLVIFLILLHEFNNIKLSGIVLLNLPLALIGGVFAIKITSGILSIPAIIGFITLFGIATRNGILLVTNYRRLQSKGASIQEIVTQGSSDRLNAILMTALTAALALTPLAIQGDLSGNEIQSPMAKVILGGLLTSTMLNIYIVPVFYTFFYKSEMKNTERS